MTSERFWSLVEKQRGRNGCWLFHGTKNNSGYCGAYNWPLNVDCDLNKHPKIQFDLEGFEK